MNYQINNAKKQLLYTPIYDGFSRIVRIKYGSGMQRSIEYNSYGQKRNVTDMLSGEQLSAWQYHYDNVGDITTLVHRANDHQQAVLNYRYDKLNNLISVICTGSAGLPLCPRDTHFKGSYLNKAPVITRQDYTFNALNRMTQVKEILTDATQQKTLSKVVNYSYGNIHAPLRLQQISTKWNNQPAVIRHFNYDIAGNMITDSENNHLTYNAFNQITQIITSDGKQSEYIYDGNGREVKQITANHDIRYMFYTGK
ncbi:MAG: RHS repeat protein, partial [Endozoicomonadaceae bacterium]|nr:RHS repeat protein [Endozoicomonadaceae bacterium]